MPKNWKYLIVERAMEITGGVIADIVRKPDWEERKKHIEKLYEQIPTAPENEVEKDILRNKEKKEVQQSLFDKIKQQNLIQEICSELEGEEKQECIRSVKTICENPEEIKKYFVG